MAIIDKLNDIAYRMEDAVMQGSPAVMERIRQDLRNDIAREKERQVQHFIATAVTNLYCGQMAALKQDVAKLALGEKGAREEASPAERTELLRCLIGSLMFYFDEDYSLLVETCEEELQRREKYGEGVEDVELPFY